MNEQHKKTMHPLLKWILYFTGAILILLIITQLFLTFFIDDYVGDYLKDHVRQSTNKTYEIQFEDLNLNIFSGSITIDSLRIDADTLAFAQKVTPTTKPPQTLYRGTVGQIDINGINAWSAIRGSRLSVGSITINRADLTTFRNPRNIQQDSPQFSSVDSTIYVAISPQYKSLQIDKFAINNANHIRIESSDTLSTVQNINAKFANIKVDSTTAKSKRLFPTDEFYLLTGKASMPTSNKMNTLSLDRLQISSENRSIAIDSFEVVPGYPRIEYSRQIGHATDRIELNVPEIRVQNFDFNRLIDSSRVYAEFVEINGARFEDFLNKSAPPRPQKNKTPPFVAFREFSQPIKIDTVRINNSYISYSEHLSKAPQAGTVTFEDLNASFYNVSNFQQDIDAGLTTELDVRTRVFGAALLSVQFNFPMDTQNGFHTISGNLSPMSLTRFNEMLKYIAFIRVDSGMLNKLEFNMRLDNERSNGDVIMNYQNLKISMLDAGTMEQRGALENIKTFIANNFVVEKNNTADDSMEAGRISFERIEHKSIFNYWWKSLLSGIKNTIK